MNVNTKCRPGMSVETGAYSESGGHRIVVYLSSDRLSVGARLTRAGAKALVAQLLEALDRKHEGTGGSRSRRGSSGTWITVDGHDEGTDDATVTVSLDDGCASGTGVQAHACVHPFEGEQLAEALTEIAEWMDGAPRDPQSFASEEGRARAEAYRNGSATPSVLLLCRHYRERPSPDTMGEAPESVLAAAE